MKSPHKEEIESGVFPVILITENNEEYRSTIKKCLGTNYTYIEAKNEKEGFEKAIQALPDIIISDLMIPEMDGLKFCKLIKNDERTNHIPFMILAEVSNQNKVEGLKIGVDDYLTKPFDIDALPLKVKNNILQRNRLQEKLRKELVTNTNKKAQSQNEQFIDKLRFFIEVNISKNELSVGFLVKMMEISRVQLYRKTYALTGLTTSEFIRTIRLTKASKLLQQRWGTVSEIAGAVGMNNLSYFSKCFRQMYGQTPSKYLLAVKQKNESNL